MNGTGAQIGRRTLGAIEELRTGENRRHRLLNGRVEVAGRAGVLVERERRLEILTRDGTPVRAARERGEDARGARQLVALVRRPAHEDALAAGRVAQAGNLERAHDLQARHLRDSLFAKTRPEGVEHFVRFRERPRHEGHANLVRTRFDGDRDVLEAGIDRGHCRRLLLVDGLEVFFAACVRLEHLRAVDRHDDPVLVLHAAHVTGNGQAADVELVVPVGRKQVFDQQAAARAERKTFEPNRLVRPLRRPVGDAGSTRRPIAHRLAADDARRGDVLIQERRRNRQNAGDVVESVGLVVFREERARIDAHRQQVLDRVGVLGPIQSVQSDASGIGTRRRLVQCVLERRDERLDRRAVGTPRAGWRHQASTQLANSFLPHLGIPGHVGGIHHVQRQPADLGALVMATDTVPEDPRPKTPVRPPRSTCRCAMAMPRTGRPR